MAKTKKVSDSYTAYAKPGAKLKKGANGLMSTTTPGMRASRARVAGERAEAPMRRKARAAAAMASAPTMKKGGSFPDLNKDGKITKADILKGRGVIAKKGSNVKRAKDGKVQSMGNATKVGEGKYKSEDGNYKMKFKGGSEGSAPTKIVQRRTIKGLLSGAPKAAGKLNMKNGGKKAPKKMMGGGKCRYGC